MATLAEMMRDASAKRQATGAAPKAIDKIINPSYQPPAQPVSTPNNVPVTGMGPTANPAPTGYTPPAYGSNVQGFDANNIQHKQLADAGQSWATAKQAGDTAGMTTASALGNQIRSGIQGSSYDSVKGISTLPTAQPISMPNIPAVTGYTPPQDAVTSVRSSSELQQQSGDGLAIERAALKNAIDTQMAALKNNAGYTNQLIKDTRTNDDFNRGNRVNPFSGQTLAEDRVIARGRDIDDTFRNSETTNKLDSLSTEIANFDKLSPERQRTIYNELLQLERQFGLSVADRTGTYAGQRTLAGSAQDYAQNPNNPQNQGQVLQNQGQGIQNQLAQLQLANYPEQVKQQAALFEQELASGKMSQQAAEYNLKELTDPQSSTNQAKAIQLQMAQLEAKNLPEMQRLELQQLKKQISQIGVVHRTPRTEAQQMSDKVTIAEANKRLAELESGSVAAPKLNTALANSLKSTYTTKNLIGEETLDKEGLKRAIIASFGEDQDAEVDQMLGFFGLPIN